MWQVVPPNVSVQCGIVNSDVYDLLYCSCHVVVFPAYYFKVLHRFYVASAVLMFMYWGWCFSVFLYLSSKVLDDPPMYSSSQSILSHLNQYMILLFFLMLSLSLGDTSKFLIVFSPLKYTCIPYFLQMFLKLSPIPLEYGITLWHIFFCIDGCCLLPVGLPL